MVVHVVFNAFDGGVPVKAFKSVDEAKEHLASIFVKHKGLVWWNNCLNFSDGDSAGFIHEVNLDVESKTVFVTTFDGDLGEKIFADEKNASKYMLSVWFTGNMFKFDGKNIVDTSGNVYCYVTEIELIM